MTTLVLKGSERFQYTDIILDMVAKSYGYTDIPAKEPGDLVKYDTWWVTLNSDDEPIACALMKTTSYGMKAGLTAQNGTSEGKRAAVKFIDRYFENGFYGEVSDRMGEIALSKGVPVVPSKYVSHILGKEIEPEPDGIHYYRHINQGGIGRKRKVMVGKPKVNFAALDTPESQFNSNKTSFWNRKSSFAKIEFGHDVDYDAHMSCLIY